MLFTYSWESRMYSNNYQVLNSHSSLTTLPLLPHDTTTPSSRHYHSSVTTLPLLPHDTITLPHDTISLTPRYYHSSPTILPLLPHHTTTPFSRHYYSSLTTLPLLSPRHYRSSLCSAWPGACWKTLPLAPGCTWRLDTSIWRTPTHTGCSGARTPAWLSWLLTQRYGCSFALVTVLAAHAEELLLWAVVQFCNISS